MSVLRFPIDGVRCTLGTQGRAPRGGGPDRRPDRGIPDGLAPIDRLIARAAREIQPLATLTPLDVRRERDRLSRELRAGGRPTPRWTYVARSHDELRKALDDAERALLLLLGGGGPARRSRREAGARLERAYLARIRELAMEAELCAAAGTRGVGPLARRRFAPEDPTLAAAASELCGAWLDQAGAAAAIPSEALIPSDSSDPRSLLSRMRQAVGGLGLPFSVVCTPVLAPLAATGDRVIFVSTGRPLSEEDAVRTVLHEIEGHARPRARSLQASSALFRAGTARGADDQEGRALLLEERAGLLGTGRRRQLAARHRAVEAMFGGASFADVARMLVDQHDVDEAEAVIVAERAFRGGNGTHPGLGRERIYLESWLRVRRHLEARPRDEEVLASGQVAVDAVDALRPLAPVAA